MKKGLYFALLTALISGFSIYINGFAVKQMKDPFVFTTAKNIFVALLFSSILIGISKWVSLKKLKKGEWLLLILIGLIGGSIPFLLFFKGLSLTFAQNAAFLHKTLFIWVTILAVIFLKEKLGLWQFLALGLLFFGNYLLGGPKTWQFSKGETLVLLATLFWSLETILAKIALKNLPAVFVSWGRMFFGSIFMLIFLFFTHRLGNLFSLNQIQILWILSTSLLLFGYVGFWYNGLKLAPASLVTCVLVLGSPITTLLSLLTFHKYPPNLLSGSLVIVLAISIFAYLTLRRKFEPERKKALLP